MSLSILFPIFVQFRFEGTDPSSFHLTQVVLGKDASCLWEGIRFQVVGDESDAITQRRLIDLYDGVVSCGHPRPSDHAHRPFAMNADGDVSFSYLRYFYPLASTL